MENQINYWGLADEYATSKHKMEKGDDISKYERYEEVKEAYEAGFLKAMEFQAERMYSEEDMKKCWNAAYIDALAIDEETYKPLFFEDFIEQFKKK